MTESLFFWFQIGMMAEMARLPPNLDNLMNEGIAFVIDRFKSDSRLSHWSAPRHDWQEEARQ